MVLFFAIQSNAQTERSDQRLDYNTEHAERDHHHKKRIAKNNKVRQHKRHKASKRHAKSMRKVAMADGQITKRERAVMRNEKRKAKRRNMHRSAPIR